MIGSQNQNRIFGLDVMRASAILMVLFGHCFWIYPENNTVLSQFLQISGFLGVEIFFVLSGFLIGKIIFREYVKEDFNIKSVFRFLKRRWFRTLPNYFLILLLNIVLAGIIGYGIDGLWRYFFFLQNIGSSMLLFFPESWSLSVEEFTYVLLPLVLFSIGCYVQPKNRSLYFLYTVIVLIAVFVCNKMMYHNATFNSTLTQWNVSLKAVVIYRIDSILIGVLCAWMFMNYTRQWERFKKISSFIGVLLFVFLFIGIGYMRIFIDYYPFFWNVIYLPLVSLAVACFLPILSLWEKSHSFVAKPITFISLISYSIYLLHYSIVLQMMKYFFKIESGNQYMLHFFTLVYLFITLALSSILYRFYEKPMMDLRDKIQN
jgi:peptidoglycan/LPS O-acetylase OafA/YrhL